MDTSSFRALCREWAIGYYTDLPFHNFQHAERVEQRAYDLCQILGLDEPTTWWVVLWARMHDAGYHLQKLQQFPTKEDYSIQLMHERANVQLKNRLPYSIDFIVQIAESSIQATKLDCTDFTTEPRKILRAADIPNLWSPSAAVFHMNTANIYRELHKLYNSWSEPAPIKVFQERQIPLLTWLLEKTEANIAEEPYFFSWYYDNFRANIERCLSEDFHTYVTQQKPGI